MIRKTESKPTSVLSGIHINTEAVIRKKTFTLTHIQDRCLLLQVYRKTLVVCVSYVMDIISSQC